MIDRGARAVRQKFPGTVMSVGHLSREGGGDVEGHRSHESGRDADIGFFVRSSGGKQLLAPHFVAFKADGTAPSWPGAYFDDAKNWTLVSSMIEDPEAHVTHLFVATPIRARLLAYAERAGAPQGARMRAAELMQQPHGVLPHDDHFHVRIGCPAHQSGCVENPTVHLAYGAHASMLAGARRAQARHAQPQQKQEERALVTPAPKRGQQAVTSTPGAEPALEPTAPPSLPPPGTATPDEPAEPPALLSAPFDDVDG
jgi:penicillin-insensitive murein endopeptidase